MSIASVNPLFRPLNRCTINLHRIMGHNTIRRKTRLNMDCYHELGPMAVVAVRPSSHLKSLITHPKDCICHTHSRVLLDVSLGNRNDGILLITPTIVQTASHPSMRIRPVQPLDLNKSTWSHRPWLGTRRRGGREGRMAIISIIIIIPGIPPPPGWRRVSSSSVALE